MPDDVVIESRLKPDGVQQGADDIEARFASMRSKIEGLGDTGEDVAERIGGSLGGIDLTSLLGGVGAVTAAISFGVRLWDEYNNSLDQAIENHEKMIDVYDRWRDKQEQQAKSSKMAPDALGDENLPPEVRKMLKAQGAEDMGFAAEGTVARYIQNANNAAALGTDKYVSEADMVKRGKEVAERQRTLSQNAEEREERRKQEEQAGLDDEYAENQRFQKKQEQTAKESAKRAEELEKKASQEGAAQLRMADELAKAEEKKAETQQRFERQQEMRGLKGKDDDSGFKATIESAEAVFTRIQTASGGRDPHEDAKRQREEIAAKQDALREKWHQEDLAKQDAVIERLGEGLGLR